MITKPWLWLALCQAGIAFAATPTWPEVLQQMPLPPGVVELNRTNCVRLLLGSFSSNDVVKALIFMPGATDEFYMFRRARARLPAGPLTLLDAIGALTNQTLIRASFRNRMLLLHTDEDPLEPLIEVGDAGTAAKLRATQFVPHALYDDRDWNHLQPIVKRAFQANVWPGCYSYDSWHFYRHSFAGWNLNNWEALEAITLAGKTRVTVPKKRWLTRTVIIFEGDERVRATPRIDAFPQ